MQIELSCPRCSHHFAAPQKTRAQEIHERMRHQGTWVGLKTGATFEEMIYSGLVHTGYIGCPGCGDAASIREQELVS